VFQDVVLVQGLFVPTGPGTGVLATLGQKLPDAEDISSPAAMVISLMMKTRRFRRL
jgi:hypothetical protein